MFGRILLIIAIVIAGVVFLLPLMQQLAPRLLGRVEQITVPSRDPNKPGRSLEMVKVLGFDGIPAILDPEFVNVDEAEAWMDEFERVLGLSINGDSRAYSIKMLSRHEVVNDVVGGVPVAVTW